MIGKAHLAIGSAVGLAAARVAWKHNPVAAVAIVTVATLASGLPDVLDSEHSSGRGAMGLEWHQIKHERERIGRHATRAMRSAGCLLGLAEFLTIWAIGIILLLPQIAGAAILDTVSKALPHRGPTHWLSTCVVLTLVVASVGWAGHAALGWSLAVVNIAAVAFGVGYLSHELADSLTYWGNPFFGPFYDKPLHLLPKRLRFRFDSPVQWLFVLGVYVVVIAGFYPELPRLALDIVVPWVREILA